MLSNQVKQELFVNIEQSFRTSAVQPKDISKDIKPINQSKEIEDISNNLNTAINGLNTNIRFGFDNRSNVFFVSLIDAETNKVIRRFPKEESEYLLERLKEIRGFLIDEVV